ncbi:hypothetical protein BDY24DRAFT_382222 [Mrakia frigida]|uniref:uncharacterized protein n=1 Tax=Mrakia frigida TaxID=29902 RepID=UPI003FCBF5A6
MALLNGMGEADVVAIDPRFLPMHTLAAALQELKNQELPKDRFHIKSVFENYVNIKREKGHKKPHISQKLEVLEKALVDQGYPDFLGPFVVQVRAESMLPKSTTYPRNGVSDLKALLASN